MTDLSDTPASAAKGEGCATDDLVDRFAAAMKEKLRAAEVKYGHNDGWMRDDWPETCIADLNRHMAKGDPRDVAAYCAFAWHHGWPTSLQPHPSQQALASPATGWPSREAIEQRADRIMAVNFDFLSPEIEPSEHREFRNHIVDQILALFPPVIAEGGECLSTNEVAG